MADFISVTKWATRFENNRTKELKHLEWVPIPNRHDGASFSELLSHKNGMAHFGAWVLIVQVASKCGETAESRGVLRRGSGQPHDHRSLALMTKGDETIFKEAIPRLISLGWLEIHSDSTIPQEDATIPQEDAPRATRARMEGKGIEGNGSNSAFEPPNLEQVRDYIAAKGYKVDPVRWLAHYTSNGWKVGKNPMKNWKAAIVTWAKNDSFQRPRQKTGVEAFRA